MTILIGQKLKPSWHYLAAALLALVGAVVVQELWLADLSVPLLYSNDGIGNAMGLKCAMESGSYSENSFLGAPYGVSGTVWMTGDLSTLITQLWIARVVGNWAIAVNLFYLLTFPTVAVASLFVFRRLGIDRVTALACSVLFTLLPFHFFRGERHIVLSNYVCIPFACLLGTWIYTKPNLLARLRPRRGFLAGKRGALSAIVLIGAVLIGTANVYYVVFAISMFVVAGVAGVVAQRSWRPLGSAASVAALTGGLFLTVIAPSIVYNIGHGQKVVAVNRVASDATKYGLRIADLILPVNGHRIPAFRAFKDEYNDKGTSSSKTEVDFSTLGLVSTIGLFSLGGALVTARRRRAKFAAAAISVTWLIAFAGVGGLAAIVAMINPAFRSTNRASVIIAFLSLYVVAHLLDRLRVRWYRANVFVWAYPVTVAAIVLLGVADQTTPGFIPPYAELTASVRSDERFTRRVESMVPKGSMIFEIPYEYFPESGPPDYDEARGYLHSKDLRWSYGSLLNSKNDQWLASHFDAPISKAFVDRVAAEGFAGIWVQVSRYQDMNQLSGDLAALRGVLGELPIASDDQNMLYFDLQAYRSRMRNSTDSLFAR